MKRRTGRNLHQCFAEPTFLQIFGQAGGLPDVHRAEMRFVRIRIADTLHDRQRMILEQFGEAAE